MAIPALPKLFLLKLRYTALRQKRIVESSVKLRCLLESHKGGAVFQSLGKFQQPIAAHEAVVAHTAE